MVYDSFSSVGNDGLMVMPDVTREYLRGGHAVCMVGYDDKIKFKDGKMGGFIVRNSWGENWGDNGYFYMPYSFALSYQFAADFWFIQNLPHKFN
jgi:C1A family cysteine protease